MKTETFYIEDISNVDNYDPMIMGEYATMEEARAGLSQLILANVTEMLEEMLKAYIIVKEVEEDGNVNSTVVF